MVSIEEATKYIYSMDLDCVVSQLSYDPHKTGWTYEDALIGVKQYRNFLFLLKKYSSQYPKKIPPSIHIDEVWHQHILNTKKYHEDCMKIFGWYCHHEPGERTEASGKFFYELFDTITQELYLKEFGEYL